MATFDSGSRGRASNTSGHATTPCPGSKKKAVVPSGVTTCNDVLPCTNSVDCGAAETVVAVVEGSFSDRSGTVNSSTLVLERTITRQGGPDDDDDDDDGGMIVEEDAMFVVKFLGFLGGYLFWEYRKM